MNAPIIPALVAGRILHCTTPHRVTAAAIPINRMHPTLKIITYIRLTAYTGIGTWLTTLTKCHLLG